MKSVTTTTVNFQKVMSHMILVVHVPSLVSLILSNNNETFTILRGKKVILIFQFGQLNDAIKHTLTQRS